MVFVSFDLSGLVLVCSQLFNSRLLQVVVGCCKLFRLFRWFQAVSSWFRLLQKVLGCLGPSILFTLFQVVLDSVRLLTFFGLSLVIHVVLLDIGSFRSSLTGLRLFWVVL